MPSSIIFESGQLIRHFKGNLYTVITVGEHTETGESMVVYRALYGERRIFVRPLEMFSERVPEEKQSENITGQEYRFKIMEDVS